MPDFKFPEINTDITKAAQDIANVAKDATYVVIGAGVLGFQKAQVQRQELIKRISDPKSTFDARVKDVRTNIGEAVHTVDAKVEDLFAMVEGVIVPLEDRLPAQARDLAKQAHVQVSETRSQIRNRILAAAG